ncbi:MAG: wax ester/triacylglycerol synthase family O-acyltransferase [Deltaproteobacteria bacterium]|nr:wax ester/triacylglycerol synthase family O-acyltransferase [Deltaproteobacteria bacterium]MBW2421615.1 wax ester/triacylglycerol synthase family O-acyltransferase [Deltaproteobacteria bacterium]
MKRVSNVDGSFLMSETSTTHMHVLGTMVLDAGHMPGGYSFDYLKKLFAERIHLLPSFRRRLVEVPLGLDLPVWIEDPDFDLDLHIHRAAIPSPGGLHELAEFVGDYASRPLERDKPLWEAVLVEGLEGDRAALVTKLHHAMMDGGAGAEVLGVLFDASTEIEDVKRLEEGRVPETVPSATTLLRRTLFRQLGRPTRVLGALAEVVGAASGSILSQRTRDEELQPGVFDAPRTSFNRAITPRRTVAFASCELSTFKTIAKSCDVTVNDVVLAACTSALRTYLAEGDELPDAPLVASVPIALRIEPGESERSNDISMMLIPLPVHLADPLERLHVINRATRLGKEKDAQAGGDVVQRVTEFATALATPGVLSGLTELISSYHLADRTPPLWNVVISNMAGPPIPLYCAGARIEAIYPMGPVIDGVGLNFTLLSNQDHMHLGIMACRELVRDVEGLAAGFAAGVGELLDESGGRFG